MQLFPWIFTAFSVTFPAGLVLYWTVNNAVTILQTMAFMRLKKAEAAKESTLGRAARGRERDREGIRDKG